MAVSNRGLVLMWLCTKCDALQYCRPKSKAKCHNCKHKSAMMPVFGQPRDWSAVRDRAVGMKHGWLREYVTDESNR